jgi:hypothetical protein
MNATESRLSAAAIGTRAPAITGGCWVKTAHGWKWPGGGVFPTPGGDWTGELLPETAGGEIA